VYVILDDLDARRAVTALELPVLGTLGILLMAKEQDRLAIIRPELDALRRAGFFISPDLYRQVPISANELG
jgi:predicted nucleic acid-binding protein